jgi:superoxide dismutase, Fe-Mn family
MNTSSATLTTASMNPAMELALCANFGSATGWRDNVLNLLRSDPSTAAAVQLVFRPSSGSLHNQRSAEAVDSVLLLTLVVGAQSSAEEAVDRVDWAAAYGLYQTAVHDASSAFAATQSEVDDALLLDVRRAGMFDKALTMIPNAHWHDPALVSQWAQDLPRDQAVVVYCIYGHEVGRSTAMRLRAAGVNARYLEGGIDAWQTAGLPLVPKRWGPSLN